MRLNARTCECNDGTYHLNPFSYGTVLTSNLDVYHILYIQLIRTYIYTSPFTCRIIIISYCKHFVFLSSFPNLSQPLYSYTYHSHIVIWTYSNAIVLIYHNLIPFYPYPNHILFSISHIHTTSRHNLTLTFREHILLLLLHYV